jgi:crotonobetainyl-CoA:carnitine CoA-transferase CaiB-like acyl-CoA transferase
MDNDTAGGAHRREPAPGRAGPLAGVRIVEASLLGPAALTTHLADLGAEVIKVEPPSGDYVREMTWPIVEGTSLIHLHINRGKRSLVLDLRNPAAVEVFLDLVRRSDAVVEAMRPGALERRGLGYERLREANPAIVFCTISGYGTTGPYRNLPSHGIAYDFWAGLFSPAYEDGFCYMPEHPSVGIHAGPLFGALGVLAGIIQARATGHGTRMEIAQSDAAAAMDWLRSETYKAYERPESEVTGNKADNYARRAPGTAGMREGVRYQLYESADGHVLFMASEQAFWRNFCEGVGRSDLFESHPGSRYADHAIGDVELRRELRDIFRTRTTAEWLAFGEQHNTPIAPVNTPKTLADDPQFQHRLPWLTAKEHGADLLPTPLKVLDQPLPDPTRAPTLGEHSEEVLRTVLGWDEARIAQARGAGVLGLPAKGPAAEAGAEGGGPQRQQRAARDQA